ncbi:cysteine hydrolase family protein [Amycolatopsis sp. RTGN1]|uniref:cysteine hydrolase family protein n=1 Tax=Amycolatopsis ponsaeliensis TaxID=2992142 RepID=UPI00254BBF35|nr:isochorismatase family protein [Amycolatopsis sp. RTGN1]
MDSTVAGIGPGAIGTTVAAALHQVGRSTAARLATGSGFIGPYFTGAIKTATGSFTYALLAIAEGSPGIGLDLPVHGEDVVVRKRRTSAFAGTDLDLVLRARGVDTVVLAGVATSAMVAATAYDAADRGYRVTVLADGCADGDPAVHEFFVEKVFPGRGFEVARCAGVS